MHGEWPKKIHVVEMNQLLLQHCKRRWKVSQWTTRKSQYRTRKKVKINIIPEKSPYQYHHNIIPIPSAILNVLIMMHDIV